MRAQIALVLVGCGDAPLEPAPSIESCLTPASTEFERPFEVDRSEYPFRSCAFETTHGRMHYVDDGPKDAVETILMVHGNPTWSFLYRNMAKAMLADGHRVVLPDHLGMGMSEVPTTADFDYRPRTHARHLEALVEALDLRNVTLVVQDWGGPIGLGMATRQPERIARVLIMNTWAWSIDQNEPGPYHALHEWSETANSIGRANPSLFCTNALPGSSSAIAAEVDPSGGALYEIVLSAYLSPALDPVTRTPRHAEPCAGMLILAQSINEDDAFQGEVESRLGTLRGKPYALRFGLADPNFGALRCDVSRDPVCPGATACVCDPDLQSARVGACGLLPVSPWYACQGPDGAVIEPYAERFEQALGSGSLVSRTSVRGVEHMIQEWDPSGVIQDLRTLLRQPAGSS